MSRWKPFRSLLVLALIAGFGCSSSSEGANQPAPEDALPALRAVPDPDDVGRGGGA